MTGPAADVRLVLLDPPRARAILAGRCPDGLAPAPGFPDANDQVAAGMFLQRLEAGLDPRPFGVFVITLPANRAGGAPLAVGGIGFHGPPDESGAVEIGYDVVASHRRRGIATAAVRAVTGYARDHGAVRLTAETEADNAASLAVLAATGFVRVAGQTDATGRAASPAPIRLERPLG